MSDTTTVAPSEESVEVNLGETAQNAFDDWSETPIQRTPATSEPTNKTSDTSSETFHVEQSSDSTPTKEEVFDEADYIKNNFGWDNKEAGLAEITRLRELEKNAPKNQELSFANDESKRLFEAIKAGKKDEVKRIIDQQDQLARVINYDLSTAEQAADVIRTHLTLKNPDLKSAEIDRLMAKKYSLPPKPQNNLDLTDEENAAAVSTWQQQVNDIHLDMIIEAKMARPDLNKYQSELVLPDINQQQQTDPQVEELRRKEAEDWQNMRNTYLQALDSEFTKFDGFKTSYKDDEVEFAVSFQPTEQEKTELKEQLRNFNKDKFFDERWFHANGKPKVEEIAADLYFLKNRDKILQKFVNESAQRRNAEKKKQLSNIQVNGQAQGAFQPSDKSHQEKMEAAIWEA